jgi:ubiquinone/menaquinone biosynthesis C-methylase UbiE
MLPSFVPTHDRGLFGGPLCERKVRAYWDSMSGDYAPDASHGLVRFSHHRQHGAVMRLARPGRGSKVLDAGAGSGLLTRQLVDLGCDTTAVDSSPAMFELLRTVTPNVILSRLEDLSVDDTFDAVLAIGVLNFVTTPEDTLMRLCAGVKRGGVIVLQVTEWTIPGLVYWLNYRARGFSPFLFTRRWLVERTRPLGFEPAGWEHPLPHDLTIALRRTGSPGC